MGLFSIEKNNRKNNQKNGKYMNFNPADMPMEAPTYRPRNITQPNNDVKNVQPKKENDTIMTIPKKVIEDKKEVKEEVKEEKHSFFAPLGAHKQKDIDYKPDHKPKNKNEEEEQHKNQETEYHKEAIDLDPLNNSVNPIPVNPIAPIEEELIDQEIDIKNVKANVFALIGMIMNMTLKPGTTIINNAKKYKSTVKSLMITAWVTILTLVSCLIVRILVGSFVKSTSPITGATTIIFNPSLLFTSTNYVEYIAIALMTSLISILVISLVYYSSSFLNSKGVPMGSYIMISNLSIIPLIIGIVILYPITSIFSEFIAIAVVIFTFLYSLMTFLIGMNHILTFKNVDRQILYNVLNLSVILMIMVLISIILIKSDILILPDLVI